MSKGATGNQAVNWAARGSAAVNAGRLDEGKNCFSRAVSLEPRNARHRFSLAIVLEALRETGPAAEQLSEALRLDPDFGDAARRLAWLIGSHGLPGGSKVRSESLQAALRHATIDRNVIGSAALLYLSRREPMRDVLALGRSKGWPEAARLMFQGL